VTTDLEMVGDEEDVALALAQMPQLRYLLFRGSVRQTDTMNEMMVGACLRRMPLLRRCGRPIDALYSYLSSSFESFFEGLDLALLHRTEIGGPPFQLEEAIFHDHRSHNTTQLQLPFSDDVLLMPNLRKLALSIYHWRPQLLHLLQNVTDLSLTRFDRDILGKVLNAVGPQLQRLLFTGVRVYFTFLDNFSPQHANNQC
jgi:hypothetical protein